MYMISFMIRTWDKEMKVRRSKRGRDSWMYILGECQGCSQRVVERGRLMAEGKGWGYIPLSGNIDTAPDFDGFSNFATPKEDGMRE